MTADPSAWLGLQSIIAGRSGPGRSEDLPGPLRPAMMDWSPSQADGSSVINVLGQNDFQTRTAASTSIVDVPGSAGIIGPPGLDNAMALVPSSPTLHDGIPSGIAGLPAPEATFAPDAAQALNFRPI